MANNIENREENQYLNILKKHNVKEELKTNLFIPKIDEHYWYIQAWREDLSIKEDKRHKDESDDIFFVINKVFKTEKEAIDYYVFLEAEAELKIAISKLNNGWIPDWDNKHQEKYYMYYASKRIGVDYTFGIKRFPKDLSFLYLKDYDSAKYIIENYRKQLLIYFGAEDE
jgi:hypothetical protein